MKSRNEDRGMEGPSDMPQILTLADTRPDDERRAPAPRSATSDARTSFEGPSTMLPVLTLVD